MTETAGRRAGDQMTDDPPLTATVLPTARRIGRIEVALPTSPDRVLRDR